MISLEESVLTWQFLVNKVIKFRPCWEAPYLWLVTYWQLTLSENGGWNTKTLVLIAGAPFPFRLFRTFSLFAPATQPSFIRSCDFRWHLNLRSGIPSSLFLLEAEAKGCLILYMLSLHSPESGLLSNWWKGKKKNNKIINRSIDKVQNLGNEGSKVDMQRSCHNSVHFFICEIFGEVSGCHVGVHLDG